MSCATPASHWTTPKYLQPRRSRLGGQSQGLVGLVASTRLSFYDKMSLLLFPGRDLWKNPCPRRQRNESVIDAQEIFGDFRIPRARVVGPGKGRQGSAPGCSSAAPAK